MGNLCIIANCAFVHLWKRVICVACSNMGQLYFYRWSSLLVCKCAYVVYLTFLIIEQVPVSFILAVFNYFLSLYLYIFEDIPHHPHWVLWVVVGFLVMFETYLIFGLLFTRRRLEFPQNLQKHQQNLQKH